MSYRSKITPEEKCPCPIEEHPEIDKLLGYYQSTMNMILKELIKNPINAVNNIWKGIKYLHIDDSCDCQMGCRNVRSNYSCYQCKQMKRFINLRDRSLSFTIVYGKRLGDRMRLVEQQSVLPEMNTYTTISNVISIDTFTLTIVNSLYIEDLFKRKGLPNISRIYSAFICGSNGYYLTDDIKQMSLKELVIGPPHHSHCTTVKSLILQLAIMLKELNEIKYASKSPLTSIIIVDEPISYKYGSISVQAGFSIKLRNLSEVSLQISGYRLISHHKTQQTFHVAELFDGGPKISNGLYKVTVDNNSSLHREREYGRSPINTSYEFYCLMTYIMLHEAIFATIKQDKILNSIWVSMWRSGDLLIVERRMRSMIGREGSSIDYQNIIDHIIDGIELNAEVTDLIINVFK